MGLHARTGSARTPLRRKVPRAQRERQMLDVAARVFGRRGFHGASMDEIARECGVTKPMLYAYFSSKQGLYLATVDRAGRHLVTAVEQLLGEPDPLTRLRLGVDVLLEFIDRDRHGWAVLFTEGGGGGPVATHVAVYRQQIVQMAALTLAAVLPDPAEPATVRRAEPYAAGMLGAGEALARWWLLQTELPLAEVRGIARRLVEAVFATWRDALPQPRASAPAGAGVARRARPRRSG